MQVTRTDLAGSTGPANRFRETDLLVIYHPIHTF
jgi:hypothetical protein